MRKKKYKIIYEKSPSTSLKERLFKVAGKILCQLGLHKLKEFWGWRTHSPNLSQTMTKLKKCERCKKVVK